MPSLVSDHPVTRAVAGGALCLRAATHIGRVRRNNEDALFIDPKAGLAILADGMGGSLAGEVAARMATEGIARILLEGLQALPGSLPEGHRAVERDLCAIEAQMRRAVETVNREIHQRSQTDPECSGMGTTLIVAVWRGEHLLLAHVGDSRAYRLRLTPVGSGPLRVAELQRLTQDHSICMPAGDTGAGLRSVLTRAVGVEESVVPELRRHRLQARDVVLLCSDGLSDSVGHESLERSLRSAAQPGGGDDEALDAAIESLIGQALEAGGRDNISLIIGSREEA